MIIRVRDKNNEERYFVEAAWIKWDITTEAVTVAVYTHVTRTKQAGESSIEVAVVPTMYIHLNNGDTVSVINDAGKVVAEKEIIVGAANRRAQRMLNAISFGGMCKACIEASCLHSTDHMTTCEGFRPLCNDDKCRCEVCEEYGKGAFADNNIDLCDSCARQDQGCTIAAGRTEACMKFQPIGRE